MNDIYSIIYYFQDVGVFDIVLPFLLIFAIVFAILEKTKIFGTSGPQGQEVPKTNINAIVSLIIGLVFIVQTNLVTKLNTYLPKMAMLYVILFAFLIFIGLGTASSTAPQIGKWASFILGVGGVIWALWPGSGSRFDWWRLTDNAAPIIIVLGVGAIIIYAIFGSRPPRPTQPGPAGGHP